jgi:hypothetical protein
LEVFLSFQGFAHAHAQNPEKKEKLPRNNIFKPPKGI